MASVIAVVGQKGGSGKTTVATGIATELIARGLRVLLVDADPQRTASTWRDVALEQGHEATTPTVVGMGARELTGLFATLAPQHDVSIIDCPPAHGEIQRAALMVADLALMPCAPSPFDVWALASSVALLREAQAIRPELRGALLLNRRIEGTLISQDSRRAIEGLGVPVLRASLCARVAYAEAGAAGLGVAQYAPRETAGAELRALVDELQEVMTHVREKTTHHRRASAKPKR